MYLNMQYNLQIFIFCIFLIFQVNSFMSNIPKINIKLKSILANRALYSTIIEKFSLDESIMTQIMSVNPHGDPTFYLTTTLYIGYILRPNQDKSKIEKLEQLEEYRKSKKMVNQLMLITFVIFIRNVEAVV